MSLDLIQASDSQFVTDGRHDREQRQLFPLPIVIVQEDDGRVVPV